MSSIGQQRFCVVRERVSTAISAALPLFAIFASVDEIERGLAAFFLIYIAASAIQLGWQHRHQIWFWCVAGAMIVAGIVQVFALNWPPLDTAAGLVTAYLAAAVNGLLWYGLLLMARCLADGKSEDGPIRCRGCRLPAEKGTVRCPHCGEWSPAPVPVWPLAVALAPVVLVAAAVIAI